MPKAKIFDDDLFDNIEEIEEPKKIVANNAKEQVERYKQELLNERDRVAEQQKKDIDENVSTALSLVEKIQMTQRKMKEKEKSKKKEKVGKIKPTGSEIKINISEPSKLEKEEKKKRNKKVEKVEIPKVVETKIEIPKSQIEDPKEELKIEIPKVEEPKNVFIKNTGKKLINMPEFMKKKSDINKDQIIKKSREKILAW